MAKYTKRRHVRRTRKHGKRRGTRRHRGGGSIAAKILKSVGRTIGFSSNKVDVAPQDTRKHKPLYPPSGHKVEPAPNKPNK